MDFDQWMRGQQAVAQTRQDAIDKHVDLLEEMDVLRRTEGGYLACCCKCGEWRELYCGPEEVDVDYEHYCGGSPYCCP